MTRPWEPWLVATSLVLETACAHTSDSSFERAMAEASRAESAGRLAEAQADYDRAAALATSHGDRDQSRWDAADVVTHERDVPGAVARLDAIARDGTSERQAEAAYRAAIL